MDPRHRQLLEALVTLGAEGRGPASDVDIGLGVGLRDPAGMGSLLEDTVGLGWVRVVNKSFAGEPLDYEITSRGRDELRAAKQRPAPPVTLDDIDPRVRAVLQRWQVDQPLYPRQFNELLGVDGLTDDDAERLLRQMTVRAIVEPYMDGWYPT
jgi:hypothetical protein